MALFQPSHIIPSNLSGFGNGVVSSASNVSVSWQVNGNSAMTAFQIDIYQNNAESTLVHSTGVVSSGYGLPFYGTDNKGNTKEFLYNPNSTWASLGLVDGTSYKLKITQYWNGTANSVVQSSESAFVAKTAPTLSIDNLAATVQTVSESFAGVFGQAQGDGINWARWELSVAENGSYEVIDDTGAINTADLAYSYDGLMTETDYAIRLTVETQSGVVVTTGWNDFSVSYSSPEASGTVSLQYDADNECALLSWQKATDIPATTSNGATVNANQTVSISEGGLLEWTQVDGQAMSFTAFYSAYWRGNVSPVAKLYATLPDDLSQERTQDVAFSPDGATLYVASDNGFIYVFKKQASGAFAFNNSYFVSTFPVLCMAVSQDGSSLVAAGGRGSVGFATVLDANTLETKTSISASFNAPVRTATYCGTALFLGGGFTGGGVVLDSVDYTTFVRLSENGAVLSSAYANGTLFIGGEIEGYAAGYSVSSGSSLSVTKIGTILMDGTNSFDGIINTISLNPTGTLACIGGEFTGSANVYSLSGNSLTYVTTVPSVSGRTIGSAWNADSSKLCLVGDYTGASAMLFNVQAGIATFLLNLTSVSTGNSPIQGICVSSMFSPDGKTLAVAGNDVGGVWIYAISYPAFAAVNFGNGLSISVENGFARFSYGTQPLDVPIANQPQLVSMLAGYTPNGINIYWLSGTGSLLEATSRSLSYDQTTITSVSLNGAQVNEFVYIAEGDLSFAGSYTPTRNFDTLFFADYTSGFQAGTLVGSTVQNALYRVENGEDTLFPVFKFPTSINKIRDFSVRSNQRYFWELFFVTGENGYSTPVSTSPFCKQFKGFTLYETTEDATYPDVYHVLRSWRFANNVTGWNVSNNNTPGMLSNFTKYPQRQPSTQSYKSGTLQSLISNAVNGEYYDSAAQMEALFEISTSTNTFFLKDIKGNLYMVHTNGHISQTMSTSSGRNEISISVPWVEIGDASNASIVQTPEDPGWDNNDVLDVAMAVNAAKGSAYAVYPPNYKGTVFGSDGFQMTARTKTSSTAPELDVADGDLIASV